MKVFFASCESAYFCKILEEANVKYALYSCLAFVYSRFKAKKEGKKYNGTRKAPPAIQYQFKETIMDSGLYSMMFGAYRGMLTTPRDAHLWYESMIETVYENEINSIIVECDFQKTFSSELAWEFRYRMRKDLPNHQIINVVWHFEDGKYGFDRLMEYSDYLALGIPEWRKHCPKSYKKHIVSLGQTIVAKGKKLHYLGCTEFNLLKDIRFATSCDSITWTYHAWPSTFRKIHNICPTDPKIRLLASALYFKEKTSLLSKINDK